MDTFSHPFWTYFLARKKYWVKQAVIASIIPDIPFIATLIITTLLGLSFTQFLSFYKGSIAFQVSNLLHSFIVFAIISIVILIKFQQFKGVVFGLGFHNVLDLFTHANYGHQIFWPLSKFTFVSPIGYAEPQYYAIELNIINFSLIITAIIYLWREKNPKTKALRNK
ncbi:MAG: metal-dependent hydrolase [Candidatus Diapherotrites archaeon]